MGLVPYTSPNDILVGFTKHKDCSIRMCSMNNKLYSQGAVIAEWVEDTVVVPSSHLKYSSYAGIDRAALMCLCEMAGIRVYKNMDNILTARKELTK